MGVTGLWRLIEPAGKPVPVETLENKVLAVDISIWLHQMVKGYQDAKGAPLANAHLMGLFQRLCKLLYFRVKPVFVFDGAFPALKRETISKRQDAKQKYNSESERIKRELAILLTKKTAISSLLGKQISPKQSNKGSVQNDDDLFKLPAIPAIPQKDDEISESDDEESSTSSSSVDLHTVDLESQNFKTLPTKEKYDLLLELKETRKMNSWGKLHTLPKKSDNFSDFQLQRLLKRRKVQECLEETEKEMGDSGMSLIELESLLNEEGIDTKIENIPTKRIASNNSTRYLLINDVRQALEDAKKKKLAENQASTSKDEDKASIEDNKSNIEGKKKDELEEDLEKAIKMSLEYSNENDVAGTSKTDDSWTSYKSDESEYFESDSEEEEGCDAPDMTSAKAYIMQYSDYTKKAIDNLTRKSTRAKVKDKKTTNVDDVLKELNFSKSQLVGAGQILSCSDDEADSDVVEVDTIESDSESVNETQASVIVLENPTQEIINLDCSLGTEQTPENSNAKKGILENNVEKELSSDDDIVEVAEIEQMIENKESSNDIQKTVEFATKSNNEYGVESDSTDNDFEEVPDEDNKAVIELNFNVAENLEDDIFADVFSPTKKDKSEITASPSLEVKVDQINQDINEDDELQKAIMMSLECIDEAVPEKVNTKITAKEVTLTAATQKTNEEITAKELENPATTVKILESNEKPRVSKTAESLNELLRTETASDTSKKQAPKKNVVPISEEQLNNMVEEIQNKEQGLEHEKGRLDRIGRNITEQMTKEAQELLQIFGIPYIVAPMEAEAQCAFLESVNLTDGTITDDSDIWLFGGRTVYKNFFNQKKHVLQFLADRIEKSFNLSREQLILLALLVGSDYTTGIDGVGPVTAMEILASFPYRRKLSDDNQTRYSQIITGLQEFKQWVRAGKRTDNVTLKKKLKNITLNDDFPSVRVVQAYLDPNVEKNEDKFSWGEIDITVVRDYAKAKFGWSQHKLDEIIKPVLKRIVERKSQKSMQDYFKRKTDFQSLEDQMSKRVKAAVQKIGDPNPETGEENIIGEVDKEKKGKRKGKKVKESVAGPSKAKKKKTDDDVLNSLNVKVVSEDQDGKSGIVIKINKTDRYQEIIPQREKDKQSLLQNKMKAIELFRKTNIDKRKKLTKRKPLVPKDKAELSESSDSN